VVEAWTHPRKDASGVDCWVSGTAWFSDGAVISLPTGGDDVKTKWYYPKRDNVVLVKAVFPWRAYYYGQQQDSGAMGYSG
jgi:hypothetical protein